MYEVRLRCGGGRTYATFTPPFTGQAIRQTLAVHPSPVAIVLAEHGVRQDGPHPFELVQENGTTPFGGHSCGLGSGRNVFSAVQSAYVAGSLDAVLTHADAATADLPPGGFADRAGFQAWWRTAEPQLEEYAR